MGIVAYTFRTGLSNTDKESISLHFTLCGYIPLNLCTFTKTPNVVLMLWSPLRRDRWDLINVPVWNAWKCPGLLQQASGHADRQADVQTEFFCEAGGCCVWVRWRLGASRAPVGSVSVRQGTDFTYQSQRDRGKRGNIRCGDRYSVDITLKKENKHCHHNPHELWWSQRRFTPFCGRWSWN